MNADPRLHIALPDLPGFDAAGLPVYAAGSVGTVLHGYPDHPGELMVCWGQDPDWERLDELTVALTNAMTRDHGFRWLAYRAGIELACAQGPCFTRGGYEAVDGRVHSWWSLWAPHGDGRVVHFAVSPGDYPMALWGLPPHPGRPRLAFVPELADVADDELLALAAILRAVGRGVELLDAATVAAQGGAR